jgi:hypothetical protein
MTAPRLVDCVTIAGIRHRVTPAPDLPVFVADMPRPSSDPHASPHFGHATLAAWLDPDQPGLRLAWVRGPDGRLLAVRASALFPTVNLAARRIGRRHPLAITRRTG